MNMDIWYLTDRYRVDVSITKCPDGTKEWYLYGKLYRFYGPAIEESNEKFNEEFRRINSSVIEYSNGTEKWWLLGEPIEPSDYYALLKIRKIRSRIIKFDFGKMLKLSRRKAIIEWYYSPDYGGGKLAKKRLETMIDHLVK